MRRACEHGGRIASDADHVWAKVSNKDIRTRILKLPHRGMRPWLRRRFISRCWLHDRVTAQLYALSTRSFDQKPAARQSMYDLQSRCWPIKA